MIDAASLASVILAIVAIALSLAFFWMSYNASKSIESSVDKLEKIYDVLLDKLFGMVGETLDDYRKHAWSEKTSKEGFSELAELKADEKIEKIKRGMSEEMEAKIFEISKKTRKTDAQIVELQTSMEKLLDKAIAESRHVEKDVAAEAMKNKILTTLLYLWRLEEKSVPVAKLHSFMDRPSIEIYEKGLIYLENENLISLSRKVAGIRYFGGDEMVTLRQKGKKEAEEIESRTQR